MSKLSDVTVNDIVQKCFDLYDQLPKTGKPVESEWTVLSCVVKYDSSIENHEVVSLGTGSKCVGASKMSPSGDILNDSHAEVFARRGFLLYLYDNLHENSPIFNKVGNKFKLKENISFIFYSSQLPCGDASIVPKAGEEELYGDVIQIKRLADEDICDTANKRFKSEPDIYRTGAKCLPDSEQDPKEDGVKYHITGRVRTKPGRGDRTLSVSCSDKMARWIQVGFQGALIDMFLEEPIFIKHFIFGAGVPFSHESLKRALLERNGMPSERCEVPYLYQTKLPFVQRRTDDNIRPAPGSIVWTKTKQCLEVAVQGRKSGMTKKKAACPRNALCISKYKLFERFHDAMKDNSELRHELFCEESIENVPYNEMKKMSKGYSKDWSRLRESFFKTWTVKPDIWNFVINK